MSNFNCDFDSNIHQKIESVCNFLTEILKYIINFISKLLITNIGLDNVCKNESSNIEPSEDSAYASNFKVDNDLLKNENNELKRLKEDNIRQHEILNNKIIDKENEINKFKKKLLDLTSNNESLRDENENLKKIISAFQSNK